jgi:hypothetical protein
MVWPSGAKALPAAPEQLHSTPTAIGLPAAAAEAEPVPEGPELELLDEHAASAAMRIITIPHIIRLTSSSSSMFGENKGPAQWAFPNFPRA